MADLSKGLGRIRFLVSRVKTITKDNVKKIEANKNEDVKAVLLYAKEHKIEIMPLLNSLKKTKGDISKEKMKELGFGENGKKADGKKAKPVKKSDSTASKLQILVPTSLTCPDEDSLGNEVFLVIGKDGLMGCGTMMQIPAD
jgi:hypothetical protein